MNKKIIITAQLALVAMTGQAQTAFDTGEGCLNVVDVSCARGVGEYGDNTFSANYLHEKFLRQSSPTHGWMTTDSGCVSHTGDRT